MSLSTSLSHRQLELKYPMEEKSPVKIPPKEEDMDMSSSSSPPPKGKPGQPMKRKLEDEDDQGSKKLNQDYEGTDREDPKKKMCQPKEVPKRSSCVKKNGTKIRSTKPSSKRIPMDVLLHNDIVLSTLEEGDMVEIPGILYSHWVVYIGDGVVVHLTAVDASTSNVSTDFCVQVDNYWDVAGTSRLKKNNSKDTRYRAYPGRDIKERALSMVGAAYYNIVLHNCEHFASLCRYGKAVSDQVYDDMTIVGGCCVAGVVTNMVLTDRAYMSKKNAPQNMCCSVECMNNGMSYRGAPECMNNGMSYRGAPECPLVPPAITYSTVLSNCTHVDERSWNATNLSEQAIVALPWAAALGACAFAVGTLIHGALTRGKDKKSQKQ